MQVNLLYHTPDPQRAVAMAARLCYAPIGGAELLESLDDAAIERVLRTIMKNGHSSTLEHASYTFAIEGVSRAMTHQLVRHRIASFNQQSQRYVTFKEEPDFIMPSSVASDANNRELFETALKQAYASYHALVEAGVPAEDARYLLPNAAETKIVVTMNIRELLHFFEVRCCNRAQWEIREVATRMLELATPTAPLIFMDAGAPCRRGSCTEGKMSCGHPFARIERD